MSFNAKSFLEDYQIPYFLENDKNVSHGFIGVTCPQCDDTSSHGGFNTAKGYYKCWRCGFHPLPKIIAVLTGVNFTQAILTDSPIIIAKSNKILTDFTSESSSRTFANAKGT